MEGGVQRRRRFTSPSIEGGGSTAYQRSASSKERLGSFYRKGGRLSPRDLVLSVGVCGVRLCFRAVVVHAPPGEVSSLARRSLIAVTISN